MLERVNPKLINDNKKIAKKIKNDVYPPIELKDI